MNVNKKKFGFFTAYAILFYTALSYFLILFIINLAGGYGFFRDEFYYIACSENLHLGYVDHPPLSIFLLALCRSIFGDSLVSIRLIPAITGAFTVFFSGRMVQKLGGGIFAQSMAAIAVITAPQYMGTNSYFSMNCLDLLIWTIAAYVIILIIKEKNNKLWLLLGLLIGLGLMNKISILWFSLGLLAGLLLTPHRRILKSKWPWLALFIALLISLPHIIWQIYNHWPTLEFIRNATGEKMAGISPIQFILAQILTMNPIASIIWLIGLFYYFFSNEGKGFRILGFIYITVFLLLIINQKSRVEYLSTAYPMLFAAGAVMVEKFLQERVWNWVKPVLLVSLIISGIILAPIVLPVLPINSYIKYADFLGVKPSTEEKKELGKLPQHYADRFGWEKMVFSIAKVYNNLTKEEQSKCFIFTSNYGEAGAIDFLGNKYNLPKAICGHNSYWLWGPGQATGEVMIRFGGPSIQVLEKYFEEVKLAAIFKCKLCMPYENNLPIYICKGFRGSLKEYWPKLKHYD